jgi:hypothetical protein
MDELLDQFPTKQKLDDAYKSFLFQPERVSVNSRQSLNNQPILGNTFISDYYNQFRVQLKTPLLRVKSLELLRASIPNAVPSIPNDECFFFYYRIPVSGLGYDAEDFTPANIYCVYLLPTDFPLNLNYQQDPTIYGWNAPFGDYDELVTALNLAAENNEFRLSNRFISGDVTFDYDNTTKRITMTGNNIFSGGNIQYFYSPVGYNDPNLIPVIAQIKQWFAGSLAPYLGDQNVPITINTDGYTLNRRLGFTFDGVFTNPPVTQLDNEILDSRVVPTGLNPDIPIPYQPATTPKTYYAENFADLVNTGNIFIYCDVTGGSTQDTNTDDRLLAVVPGNASSLGVIFGESKIPCELTKTAENIYQILFSLKTDKGTPFNLPTNAYINLELKVNYK